MLKSIIRYSVAAALLLQVTSCSGQAQVNEQKKELVMVDLVKRLIEQAHYDPGNFDDEFSKEVFAEYFKQADVFKRFFTQEDIDKLKKYETDLDDEFKNYDFNFFNASSEIYVRNVARAEKYCDEILEKPFDFNVKESYELDPEKRPFPKDEKELYESWRLSLKYEVITRLASLVEAQEKKKFDPEKKDDNPKTMVELEAEAREKVAKRYKDWFHELNKLERADRMADYVNALIAVLDPHSNYFPPKEKEDFDISFSGQLQGIGATLTQRDGYITVANIVPGSPSWKQGELAVDDKILKVAQGDDEAVDVVDMRLDKAVRLVRGKKGTKVRLTVRKVDGSEKEISIIRDLVIIEETYAKSAVVTDSISGRKTGYIYLPSFYANFDDPNGRSSSEDMKKEVLKLKEQGVSGIVLDLRGNGGGSLQDAIEIAGLFIDQGPVVQVKARYGKPQVYGDPSPGAIYDGPLAIMINPLSASASEILAAAMQDHHRAIIVGSTSFGKGTVQRFFNLDDMARGYDDVKPLGALKLTIQKFYRINGGATQLKGVTPDITLPDMYAHLDVGERDLDHPMPWTEIEKAAYQPLPNQTLFGQLDASSIKRQAADTIFKLQDENALRLKAQRDRSLMPLDMASFRLEKQNAEKATKRYSKIDDVVMPLFVVPLNSDLNSADTGRREIVKRWVKNLRTDNYLYETTRILSDWNTLGVARKE